jgi:hypothetical protein
LLGFLASVGLEGLAIFDYLRERGEVWDKGDFNIVCGRSTGEVAQFAWIRGGDQDLSHRK